MEIPGGPSNKMIVCLYEAIGCRIIVTAVSTMANQPFQIPAIGLALTVSIKSNQVMKGPTGLLIDYGWQPEACPLGSKQRSYWLANTLNLKSVMFRVASLIKNMSIQEIRNFFNIESEIYEPYYGLFLQRDKESEILMLHWSDLNRMKIEFMECAAVNKISNQILWA